MKGQLQIGESIMVIIILTILGIFLLTFYSKMAGSDIKQKIGELDRLNALETAQAASSLYELKCSKPGVTYVCFDVHKAQALSTLRVQNSDYVNLYYQDLFGNAKISLSTIGESPQEYVIYWNNATDPTTGELLHQTVIPVVIPVIIHNPSTDTNNFGVYSIERYS